MNSYLIINFDSLEYLRPQAFGEHGDLASVMGSHDGILFALAALLADGNGRGGGDLDEAAVIGTWAGCRIALVDDQVLDAALSIPGQEHVPLQQQALEHGTDVSASLVKALCDSEGQHIVLSYLSTDMGLSLVEQRELGPYALQFFRDAKRFERLEDLFSVLGVSAGLTPSRVALQLADGLRKTAERFGRPERYQVDSLSLSTGAKQVSGGRLGAKTAQGICALAAQITDANSPAAAPLALNVTFGRDSGTTLAGLFATLFPGLDAMAAQPTKEA